MTEIETPPGQEFDRKELWQERWSKEGFSPLWLTKDVPDEVINALDAGFFKPGDMLLDIGCGRGDLAAYLADRGMLVTGIDFADAAIAKATSTFDDKNGALSFHTVDICQDGLEMGPFSCLLDRGCFHAVPSPLKSKYAANVATCAGQRARFLMLHKTRYAEFVMSEHDIECKILAYFTEYFKVLSLDEMTFGSGDNVWPGVSIMMKKLR